MCVCVCVRRPAAGATQAITPKFGKGSHFTLARHRARGRPQMLTPGGTPYIDPVWKPLKGKEFGGGQQTKVAPRGGFAM